LAELSDYQQANSQYFPKSVESLLSGWTKTLDRARSNERQSTQAAPKTLVDKELTAIEKQLNSLESQ
jgi:hypothetical protein